MRKHVTMVRSWVIVSALITTACATGPQDNMSASSDSQAAFAQFEERLADCTKQYGYDPDNPPPVSESELAPNERAWRTCAYEGVETILIPNTNSPQMYKDLIATDQILTNDIEKGSATRSIRKAKIDELINNIQIAEADHLIATDPEMKAKSEAQRMEHTRSMVNSLRRF